MSKKYKNIDKLCVGHLSSIIYRQFQVYINSEMKEYNINSSEFIYLLELSDKNEMNQKDLADIFHTDNAIISRSLQSLEEKGLIIRRKSESDKRYTLVLLTLKGLEAKKIGVDKRKYWRNIVMEDLSDEEKEILMPVLKKIAIKTLDITKK